MSIKKQVLKSKPVCKVTFKIEKENAMGAKSAFIVGEFNNWNETSHEMKVLKDGSFSINLDVETGRSYQFRYLLDGNIWINDSEADSYAASGIGEELNAVVVL
jgi:1,4-alpha-glucan branching enzyme